MGLTDNRTKHAKKFGKSTIYDGDQSTPYMTRYVCGRNRFHVFHRGDKDPDPHSHPWGFYTFPLVSYVEEVFNPDTKTSHLNVVKRFKLHYRDEKFCHRVLCSETLKNGNHYTTVHPERFNDLTKKIYTFVRTTSDPNESWGFWMNRDGKWCFKWWKDYVNGGKHAPCE